MCADSSYYCAFLQLIRRGYFPEYFEGEGVVVKCQDIGTVYAACQSDRLLQRIDFKNYECAAVYDLKNSYDFKSEFGCEWQNCAFHCAYERSAPPVVQQKIRALDEHYLDLISKTYTLGFSKEKLKLQMEKFPIFGIFIDDELCGYIGRHTDGSMGMLEIFEKYRRRGLGTALENYLIRHVIHCGDIPFGHVFTTNQSSIAAQRKLGMTVYTNRPVVWCGMS